MAVDESPYEERPHAALPLRGLLGSTIRTVLVLSFVFIFGLWFASSYELVQRVSEAERQSAATTAHYAAGEELLSSMRAQVLLSSVYIRDAVLERDAEARSLYREQLQATRVSLDQAMAGYLPNVDSSIERTHWTEFQSELQNYWESMSPLLTGDGYGTVSEALAFVRRELLPKRDVIVRVSDDLRALNQDALLERQAELAKVHQSLRQRLWWTSGMAVALGLAIATFAVRYAGQLESRIVQQHLQERHHTRELQRLSGELVHAQETERRKIGRDLHDEIGQALMTIKLNLGAIERSGQVSGGTQRALAEARSTTDLAVQSVRDLSQLLHPAMLDQFGLAVTLEAYVRRFSQRTGVDTALIQERMAGRFASEQEITVYRVVQEALTNVSKHAEATSCRVYLQRLPYSILVTVEDNGKGFDPATLEERPEGHGVGLLGVRERVSRLGGTFRLDASPGRGTRLTIELPADPDQTGPHQAQAEPPVAAAPFPANRSAVTAPGRV